MIVTRSTSILLGLAFVLLGGINVWLMLEAWSRVKAAKASALDGHVRMTAEQGLDPESKGRGFVLTCVGYADGNVKLDA